MKHYIILVFIIFSLSACSKYTVQSIEVFNGKTGTIHIICDARKTGTVEPWLFEFGNMDGSSGIDTRRPDEILFPRIAHFELESGTETGTIEYLGGMPLIEPDSLHQIILPSGVSDTAYKHYSFTINRKLLDKALFKFTAIPDTHYGYIRTSKNTVTVILSTNDTNLTRAVERCNQQLTDSTLSQKGFYFATY